MHFSDPFTVTLRIDSEANRQLAVAIIAMRQIGLEIDGLIEAFINGVSPTYYVAARKVAHSHYEIMANKTFVSPIYIKLRENQGCSADEAMQVYELTEERLPDNSSVGSAMRAIYRAAMDAGLSHAEAVHAMAMQYITYGQLDWRVGAEKGKPNKILDFFKAAVRQICIDDGIVDLNDIWRAWCTACNKPRTDLPPLESLLKPAGA